MITLIEEKVTMKEEVFGKLVFELNTLTDDKEEIVWQIFKQESRIKVKFKKGEDGFTVRTFDQLEEFSEFVRDFYKGKKPKHFGEFMSHLIIMSIKRE